jgi:HAE1 family hydrophobic/amphiphilic exporter-1
MDIISYSINKPVSVTVAVILVVMFGLIGLNKLPVQLTPDVETPQITVNTSWGGATPYEVEKEIIEKQEEVLKGIQALTKMESSSYNSYGEITLSFALGTDLDDALLRVSNKLNEVTGYPDTADRPKIEAAGAQSSPVIWMMLKTRPENQEHINHFRTFFENNIRQHLERVQGVGSLFVFGGTENELHITLEAEKMARYNVSINQVMGAVTNANRNVSAGVLGIDKKNYRIRTVSQFQAPEDALEVVIFDDGIHRVYLGDVARTTPGYAKENVAVLHNGIQVIVVGVRKEQGANVLEMTERLQEEVDRLNGTILAENDLYIDWVYDQRPYINRAIRIVKQNILIGGFLAICVLLLFLRSITSTITTALAIPISTIGTFIFLWLMGRNLNVVSLAGISFAVGMLVDNAIVVLENIDRHRKMGKAAFAAAYEGTKEVWGAILASTATTVAVFLPVIFMQEEAGQLFRDIAIAITFAILLSLFVSISVIPTLIHQFYKRKKDRPLNRLQKSVIGPLLASFIMRFADLCLKNTLTRLTAIIAFTSISVALTWLLMPSAEYLPQGNRNLILNFMSPPPGYSVDKLKEMGRKIYSDAQPYFKEDGKDGIPMIKQIFYVGADRITLFGALSVHETKAQEMMPLFQRIMNSFPGLFGVSIQAGIFEHGIGQGRNIDVNISGSNIPAITSSAWMLRGIIMDRIPGAQVRPVPSTDTSYPEVRIDPNKEKLAANGLTEEDLGIYVDILMDGRKIGEYRPEGIKQTDLVLKGSDRIYSTPEDILHAIIVNSHGDLIRLGDVSTVQYSSGMPQIDHLERTRNITLQVTPPQSIPLQQAMETIETDIIGSLKQAGQLQNVQIRIGGNADKLVETGEALKWNLLLALLITYLLIAALFENFIYPLIILFTVPLAAAGGFIGLLVVKTLIAPHQAFDVLAMLGFIILIGTVVNNAILVVHQSLNNVRYHNRPVVASLSHAIKTRIRPIFMSATTSLLALSPLVLSTGSGSELYRGLGSILLGGLAVSTMFTLFVIPSLLSLVIGWEKSRTGNGTSLS